MANLYVIAGCNGAGKTTASYTLLPEMLNCKEFVNADEIARGLSPFQADKVAVKAGRIMLERIKSLIDKKIDFAFETTLATRTYAQLISEAQRQGYYVTLIYYWLSSAELAIERVKTRVLSGGHNIPEETIKRRYTSGILNLSKLYIPICDNWMIFDNSLTPSKFVAEGFKTVVSNIYDLSLYNEILKK
ncbi:MAG: zeta toxin family protein [Bacteroidetes bacterium]|nr:zeta toxin family protein [Bacteroidota bacterium]